MKLDRNINPNGRGKYALLLLRKLFKPDGSYCSVAAEAAIHVLENLGIIDWIEVGSDSECFPIRLKDKYAQKALRAYAEIAEMEDPEYAAEVREMADRAGPAHPACKKPD